VSFVINLIKLLTFEGSYHIFIRYSLLLVKVIQFI